jgi:hypothetical protein
MGAPNRVHAAAAPTGLWAHAAATPREMPWKPPPRPRANAPRGRRRERRQLTRTTADLFRLVPMIIILVGTAFGVASFVSF